MNLTFGRVAVLLSASVTAVIAAPQQQPTFSGNTRTVAVYATVTNAQGRLVTDLTRDDFSIADDGKPQTLTVFSNDIQPITVVMLLDRSGSLKPNYGLEVTAASAFVREMLPADKARIGTFGTKIQIDPTDFTSSRDELQKILRGDLPEDGPTPLWNAVDAGIDKLLPEQGRRVVLVFTDGVDRPLDFEKKSKSLKDVMKRAEEKDVMVYAIGLAGQNAPPSMMGRGDSRGGTNPGAFGGLGGRGLGGYSGRMPPEPPDPGLAKLAEATGGGYFEITSPIDVSSAFVRVAEELHHQYSLGFAPEKLDGKMHEITVRVSKPDLRARARKRYLASKP